MPALRLASRTSSSAKSASTCARRLPRVNGLELAMAVIIATSAWGSATDARRASWSVAALELPARQRQHLTLAGGSIEPQERQVMKFLLQQRASAADLDHQHAVAGQIVGRLAQNAPHDGKTVGPGGVGKPRLGRILGREGGDGGLAYVGRIGQNQVIAAAGQRGKHGRVPQTS